MASPSQPNVVLVHCHDLGRYLGCYGVDVETPAIDALAEAGVVFDNHFVTAPQCSPSRGSLMTGRYPHQNGLIGLAHERWGLHPDERILPHYLKSAGYETHLFGLQHITQDTDRLRYDVVHSEGNLYPGVSPAVHQVNRARTVASVFDSMLGRSNYETPFFACVGFFECHRFENEMGRYGFDPGYYDGDQPHEITPLPYLPDRYGIRCDLAEMRGMVYAIDDAIARIRQALARADRLEETILILTTEHGIAFPRAKGTCFDAGIEAALVWYDPTLAGNHERYSGLISNIDVVPTILDRLGRTIPDAIAGRSFLPVLSGGAFDERERIFAEMTWHDLYNPVRAIRTARYKYIRSFWHLPRVYLPADVFASESGREVREEFGLPGRPYEQLYDLRNTPQEDANVVYEPRYQDIREDLSRQLYEWMRETDDPILDGPVLPSDYADVCYWPHLGGSQGGSKELYKY